MGRGSVVSWCELWEVACLCVGEVKGLGKASLAANLFPAKSTKGHQKRSWKNKKRKEENTSFPEILKTARFLENKCKQEFQQNKTKATAMA